MSLSVVQYHRRGLCDKTVFRNVFIISAYFFQVNPFRQFLRMPMTLPLLDRTGRRHRGPNPFLPTAGAHRRVPRQAQNLPMTPDFYINSGSRGFSGRALRMRHGPKKSCGIPRESENFKALVSQYLLGLASDMQSEERSSKPEVGSNNLNSSEPSVVVDLRKPPKSIDYSLRIQTNDDKKREDEDELVYVSCPRSPFVLITSPRNPSRRELYLSVDPATVIGVPQNEKKSRFSSIPSHSLPMSTTTSVQGGRKALRRLQRHVTAGRPKIPSTCQLQRITAMRQRKRADLIIPHGKYPQTLTIDDKDG